MWTPACDDYRQRCKRYFDGVSQQEGAVFYHDNHMSIVKHVSAVFPFREKHCPSSTQQHFAPGLTRDQRGEFMLLSWRYPLGGTNDNDSSAVHRELPCHAQYWRSWQIKVKHHKEIIQADNWPIWRKSDLCVNTHTEFTGVTLMLGWSWIPHREPNLNQIAEVGIMWEQLRLLCCLKCSCSCWERSGRNDSNIIT